MMAKLVSIFLLIAGFTLQVVPGQNFKITPVIEVTAWVLEKTDDSERGLQNLEVWVQGAGDDPQKKITDAKGSFQFKTPKNKTDIRIDIPLSEYAVMDPRDGSVSISSSKTSTQIRIWVISKQADLELFNKMNRLTEKVRKLEISKQRQDAYFRALRDSIVKVNEKNKALKKQSQELKTQLKALAASDKLKSDSLNALVDLLAKEKQKNEDLLGEIEKLKEEKYLRQQGFYDQISEGFKLYMLKARDIQQQMKKMPVYVKNWHFYTYTSVVEDYNKQYEAILEYPSLVKGVERYWEDEELAKELQEVYTYLIETVHKTQIMVPVNEMNGFITGSKTGKLKKKSVELEALLPDQLSKLQEKIDTIVNKLDESENT